MQLRGYTTMGLCSYAWYYAYNEAGVKHEAAAAV